MTGLYVFVGVIGFYVVAQLLAIPLGVLLGKRVAGTWWYTTLVVLVALGILLVLLAR